MLILTTNTNVVKFFFLILAGYAIDPTIDGATDDNTAVVGATLAAEESSGKTVFESTKKRPLDKRKRKKNDNPEDIEGFLGPWGCYEDEQRVVKPNDVSIASLIYWYFS